MNMLRHLGLGLSLLASTGIFAQFTLEHVVNQTIYPLGSLSAGFKYIDGFYPDMTGGTRTVYNLDMTVYRVLNYPDPPAGMRWASMGYITDALFDTDESTIEFTMTAMVWPGPGDFAAHVIREDGSVLFVQNPGNFTSGPFLIESFGPIYTTTDGTFMAVHTTSVNGPPVNIYRLPGSLPCKDCYGNPDASGIGLGGSSADPAPGSATAFIDASGQQLHVALGSSGGDEVSIWDATGRLVTSKATAGSDRLQFSTQGWAPGLYNVVVVRDGRRSQTLPVVIH